MIDRYASEAELEVLSFATSKDHPLQVAEPCYLQRYNGCGLQSC
jgi:hypothetical protein